MNGADRTFSLKSDNMAQDVKYMEQIINQLRASKRNESADDLEALNAQSYQCRETFEQIVSNQTLRKERAVQTCVLTKEKQIQTTGDHTLSKQVEAKDRRIAELEDALAKSRKKEEKMSKVEKELVDARLKCQRQTKEIGNLESFKKGVEGQRAEIEHLWESNEKLEQNYEVEKNRSAELERRCHDIQNQLHQVKMDQDRHETRINLDQRNEYEMKYRKKADRVNEFKEALRDVYKHNIALEAALKTGCRPRLRVPWKPAVDKSRPGLFAKSVGTIGTGFELSRSGRILTPHDLCATVVVDLAARNIERTREIEIETQTRSL